MRKLAIEGFYKTLWHFVCLENISFLIVVFWYTKLERSFADVNYGEVFYMVQTSCAYVQTVLVKVDQ